MAVADKLSLNGRTHVYRDRLRIGMEKSGSEWMVVRVENLPIAEERAQLKEFLDSAGKLKKGKSAQSRETK